MEKSINPILHYNAHSITFEHAHMLRKNNTETEKLFWETIRNKKLAGLKFRRQHPIDRFIVDFYCHELKLVIEIDGGVHNLPEQKEYDINRTYELKRYNLSILRVTNEEVLSNIDSVINKIINFKNELKQPHPQPLS